MNIKIDIQGIKELQKGLSELQQRQIPFALSVALNKSAYGSRQAAVKEIADSFDRPTPIVKRGVLYTKSDKRRLVADVYVPEKTRRGVNISRILRPHIYGGHRRVVKASERRLRRFGFMGPNQYMVPGPGAPRDRYGNISGANMTKILSGAAAFQEAGYTGKKTRKRNRYYFVQRVGIFKRTGRDTSIPVLFFTDKKPRYEKRFDFHYAVRLYFEKFFEKDLSSAWNYALSTARAKS
jgi:hypothetical protein